MARRLVAASVTLTSIVLSLPSVAGAAGGHICALPIEVEVGEPSTLVIGVGAESTAVTAVEIELPDGFELTAANGDGWQVETGDDVVRFTDSSVAPFACGYVTLEGVAEQRSKLVFPLVMETAAGESVRYDSAVPHHEQSAQLIYAGMDAPTAPEDEGAGTEPLEIAGWALTAAGVILIAWLTVGWWKAHRANKTADK